MALDNQDSEASLRLSKLGNTPTTTELDYALEQAKKNTSAIIELPWKSQSSPTFVLKISASERDGEANWVLCKGETADAAVLWSFDSDDTSLIESLIAAETASERSFASAAGTSKPVNGGASAPAQQAAPVPQSAPSAVPSVDLPPPVELDRAIVDEIDRNLRNPETGLNTRAAFFFFMIREYCRFESVKSPMAVIVFELLVDYGNDKIMPLPERALKEAFRRFQGVMRSVDIVAHYQERQFAFLLPGISSNDAVQFGKKIEKVLLESPLQPGLNAEQAVLVAGVASIPDTCDHPGILLAACEKALAQAKERRTSLALFPSLANR